MKNESDECKINSCENKTKFVNKWYGYRRTCSEECKAKDRSHQATASRKNRRFDNQFTKWG